MIRCRKTKRKIALFSCLFSGVILFAYLMLMSNSSFQYVYRVHATEIPLSRMKDSHLLVLIITSPVNLDRRDAIRRTWIADAVERDNLGSFLTFRFVVGVKNLKKDVHEQLINEQGKNHDLLMLDELVDRYESLSMKLGLMVEHVHDKGNIIFTNF